MKNLVTVELHPGFVIRFRSTGLPEGGTGVRLSRLACQRLADALHAAAEQGAKAGTFIVAGEEAPAVTLRHTVVHLNEPAKRSGAVYLNQPAKRRGVVKL